MQSSIVPQKVLLKVIILGESGVGKTALLNHYVNNQFIEDYKATIGADFMTKDIQIDNNLITLQLWDTAGQERFRSLGNAFYRGADAAILVYDITDLSSFQKLDEWKETFLNICDTNNKDDDSQFPILLLGNKHDLSNQSRKVDQTAGNNYAKRQNMLFYETSAMNGHNINQAIKEISQKACQRETAPYVSSKYYVLYFFHHSASANHMMHMFVHNVIIYRKIHRDLFKEIEYKDDPAPNEPQACPCQIL